MTSVKPRLYVLVDGEDMDIALGKVLGHKPLPSERPRWRQVLTFARMKWSDRDVKGLFFMRLTHPLSENIKRFVGAVTASGFKSATADDVKQKIEEVLRELVKREGRCDPAQSP